MLYVYQLAQITLTAQILDIQAAVCGADYEQWKPTWGCETRKLVCGCSDTWRIVGIRRLMKLCSCEEHEIIFNQRVICNRQPQENIWLVECWHACFFFMTVCHFSGSTKKNHKGVFTGDREGRSDPFSSSHTLCISYFYPSCPNSSTASLLSLLANQKHVGRDEKEERHETEKVWRNRRM